MRHSTILLLALLLLPACDSGSDDETSCTPSCDGKACGDDGCGGSCGVCDGETVTGELFFQARFPQMDQDGSLELSALEELPAAGMLAVAMDAEGEVLGISQVDDEGGFSVTLSRPAASGDLVAFACLWAPSLGSEEVKLLVGIPEYGGEPYPGDTTPWIFTKALGASSDLGRTLVKESQGSGAIYTFLLAQLAMRTVQEDILDGDGEALDPLALLWKPGTAWTCGACYGSAYPQDFSGTVFPHSIFMGGEEGSSSAWGYTVILHEFGHYVADRYLRDDSPGGPHSIGSAIVPSFAFSEGFATFFSLSTFSRWVGGPQPLYWDIQGGSSFWVDYSSFTFQSGGDSYYMTLPTMDGGLQQKLDENFVGSVLWHLWDGDDIPDSDDPEDGTALGTTRTLAALASYRFLQLDRAYPGADLVDYLDAVACNFPDLAEAMYETVINRLGFPYDDPIKCD